MKHEVMAAAITDIDEKLIEDAETKRPAKRSFRSLYAICAVAACLIIVFTFVFIIQPSKTVTESPKLSFNDTLVGDTPVNINAPASLKARGIDQRVSLSLSLEISEDTCIKVSQGKMDICLSDNTDKVIFSGDKYKTDKSVNINWYIDGSDINSVYTLTLDDSINYTLSYDASTSVWSICKQ